MANLGYVSSFNINGNELSLKDAALTEIVEEIIEAIGANNGDISERINNLHDRSFDALIKISSQDDSEIASIQDGIYKLHYVAVTGEGEQQTETLNNSAILIQQGTHQYLYKDGKLSNREKTNDTWGDWITFEGGVTSVNGQTGAVTIDAGVTSFNGQTGAVTYTAPVTSVDGKTGIVTIEHPVTSVNGQTGAVTIDTGVTSFNGQTGAVTYTAPVTSVDGKTGTVTIEHPVTSVNGQTGAVTIDTGVTSFNGQTGAVTYTAPVTSVNGQTGAVTIDLTGKADKSAAIGSLRLSINSTDYKVTLSGTKVDGTAFTCEDVIDLPLETMVVSGAYDDTTQKIVLTLKNGTTTDFPVSALIDGLQSEITSTNKLSADLISDGNTNKVVTQAEKDTWNNKVTSVNGQTGVVTIDTGVTSFNGQTGVVTYTAPVTSVNGQTGVVTIDTGVTSFNGQTGAVTYTAPVTSVNGQTGAVTIDTGVTSFNGQTGAVTYTAPVTSVNGQTGAVTIYTGGTYLFDYTSDPPTFFDVYNNEVDDSVILDIINDPNKATNTLFAIRLNNDMVVCNFIGYGDNGPIYGGSSMNDQSVIHRLTLYEEDGNLRYNYDTLQDDSDKVIAEALIDLNDRLEVVEGISTGDENIIEAVKVNGTTLVPDANKAVNISVPVDLADLTDDATHRLVTDTEKSTWNNKVTSVNGQTGAVTIDTGVTSFNGQTGAVNITIPTKTSDITNDSGFITDAGVTSFNGQTGAVTYTAPVTSVNGQTGAVNLSIPDAVTESTVAGWGFTKNTGTLTTETQLSKGTATGTGNAVTDINVSNHQITLVKGKTFLETAPVTSVNGQTGAVTIDTGVTSFNGQTGAVTYTAPVTSVNGQTGAVNLSIPDAVTESTVAGWGFTKNTGTLTTETQLSKGTSTGTGNAVTDINVSNHQITLVKGKTFLETAPVASVNGQTGAVTIDTGVTSFNGSTGAVTYTAPVTSVNGQTGAVTVKANVQSDWNAITGDAVILNKPTIPTVNDSTVTLTMNGNTVGTFTLNKSGNTTIDLGNVLTSHQSIKTINNQTITGTGNISLNTLPTVSASDNGKVLMVVNGAWQLVSPVTLYSGSGTPANSQGNNGDLYIQS